MLARLGAIFFSMKKRNEYIKHLMQYFLKLPMLLIHLRNFYYKNYYKLYNFLQICLFRVDTKRYKG